MKYKSPLCCDCFHAKHHMNNTAPTYTILTPPSKRPALTEMYRTSPDRDVKRNGEIGRAALQEAPLLFAEARPSMAAMKESQRFLLCPQCGSRRMYIKSDSGEAHYVYVLTGNSVVYSKTGDCIPEDLDTSDVRCADCSWSGPLRKLTRRFMY